MKSTLNKIREAPYRERLDVEVTFKVTKSMWKWIEAEVKKSHSNNHSEFMRRLVQVVMEEK